MQYIMLIYEDESVYGPDKAGDATNQVVAGHMAFGQQLGAKRIGGAGLQNTPNATTVRTAAGGTKTLHDGPFAEMREALSVLSDFHPPIRRRSLLRRSMQREARPGR